MPFPDTALGDFHIRGGTEILFDHSAHIMTGGSQKRPAAEAEVFVQLQPHAEASSETAT